jgi:hypothetical protein
MNNNNGKEHLRPWAATNYRIEVEGYLEESWSERIAGMQVSYRKRADQSIITCLFGPVMDQAELSGILNGLAELHLPILKVENVAEK